MSSSDPPAPGGALPHLPMDAFFLLMKEDVSQDTQKTIKPHFNCKSQSIFVTYTMLLKFASFIFINKPDA